MEISKCMGCMGEYRGYPCPSCGYDPQKDKKATFLLPQETILGGKYLIGRVLGQGGFGITYIGWDIALERKVAIKEYYPSGQVSRMPGTRSLIWSESDQARAARQDGMQMFLKEARKMAKLEDIPGVVKVRDLFQENETAYIVMDFVEGQTLKSILQRSGPMAWEQARGIFSQAIRSMELVHEAGLIHRDLSPDNLMITPGGSVRILDLGAAKDLKLNSGASSMQVAKGGFSPYEQYTQRGGSGTWTDVYAMAATIYYTLTGKVPPPAMDRMEEDALRWDHPNLRAMPAPALDALKKAMTIMAKQRTQTMTELKQGLFAVTTDPVRSQRSQPAPEVKPIRQPENKLPKWVIPAAAAVLACAVILPLALGSRDGSGEENPSVVTPPLKSKTTVTPDKNWEKKVDALIAAGTEDVYVYENGAKLEMYFDGDDEAARIFTNEEGTVEFVFKACYDDDGNLLEELGYDGEGTLMRREVYSRDTDGNCLEDVIYDQNGKQIDKWIRTYDSQGRIESWTHFDSALRRDRWCSYTYDDTGKGTGKGEYLDGRTSLTILNANGDTEKATYWDADGHQENCYTYRYDSEGRKIEWADYDENGALTYKNEYEYTGDLETEWTSYSYSSDGTLYTTTHKNRFGPHDVKMGWETVGEDYSNSSQDVRTIQGQVVRSFSVYSSQYDNSTGVSYYDWDGNIQNSVLYDENGQIRHKNIHHYDTDGNRTGQTSYSYSSYSNTTTVTEYDADYNKMSEKEYSGRDKLLED